MQKITIFDNNGNGLKEIKNPDSRLGFIFSEGGYLKSFYNGTLKEDGKNYSIQKWEIFDENLKKLRDVYYSKVNISKTKYNEIPEVPFITLDKQNGFYKATSNLNDYLIEHFSQNNVKDIVIQKAYKKIKLTKDGIDVLVERNKRRKHKLKIEKFKKSIKSLSLDKNNYLWVRPNLHGQKNSDTYDIFKDGIYLNRVKTTTKGSLNGNFFLATDNNNTKIKVFSYSLSN